MEDLDIASYAGDTITYIVKENKESVTNTLETSSLQLFKRFNNNFMKANSDKSHTLLSFSELSTVVTDGCFIESNIKEVLLGITIDRKLRIDDNVNNLCKKLCQKLNTLSFLAPFMNVNKRRMIIKAFTESNLDTIP